MQDVKVVGVKRSVNEVFPRPLSLEDVHFIRKSSDVTWDIPSEHLLIMHTFLDPSPPLECKNQAQLLALAALFGP